MLKRLSLLLWLVSVLAAGFATGQIAAQDDTPTQVQIRADTTTMITGERYPVRLVVTNIDDFWTGDMTINYDPQQIYVIGTRAGSPVVLSDEMENGGLAVLNTVNEQAGRIQFIPSRLAPAEPLSGTITLGQFEIVPLRAGETQLTFRNASLSSVSFSTNDAGTRVPSEREQITPQGVLLSLTINGDPATPPPEASATPTPTATEDPVLSLPDETAQPTATFENVTPVPDTFTPVLVTPTAQPAGDNVADGTNQNTIFVVGVGLVVLALLVLGGVFIASRRRS